MSAESAEDALSMPLLRKIREIRGKGQGPYEPVTRAEQVAASGWIERRLCAGASEPGDWFLERGLDSGDLVLFAAKPGHGVYLWRTETASPLLVEVPHSFADVHTLPIGLAVFQELGARALLVNGTHRRYGCEPGATRCPADVAHAPASVFEAVHEAFVGRDPGSLVIQVHGFEAEPADPLVILSAARTRTDPRPCAEVLRRVLAGLGPRPVAVYPDEVDRLGGTTSVQARHLRRVDGRMLHVEMSRGLRDRLLQEPALLRAFARALAPAGVPTTHTAADSTADP